MNWLFDDAVRDRIVERCAAVGRVISAEAAKACRADLSLWGRYLEV